MKLKTKLLAACLSLFCHRLYSQCVSAPVFPECTGTEPLMVSGDIVTESQTKYFYGTPSSLSNVQLRGGTLVICGELTLNDFVLDSGTIFILPHATLTVSNGAGLVVKGNSAIYNAGVFQSLGNYVMDGTYASDTKPNLFVNVRSNSFLKMPNQYFVINNRYSWLVNNGIADFHGLITDPLSAGGSVCLGHNSQTRMRVLYNKSRHPYVAPNGPACVSVSQYSQFHDTLTAYPHINICLGNMHNSDASCIPWGCRPNAWGAAQVSTSCSSCASLLTFLADGFSFFKAVPHARYNELSWQSNPAVPVYIQRSTDGALFHTIDSVYPTETKNIYRDYRAGSLSYYRLMAEPGMHTITSQVVMVKRNNMAAAYPNPFRDQLTISIEPGQGKPLVRLTDLSGRELTGYRTSVKDGKLILHVSGLPAGVYFISVEQRALVEVYKVVRTD